MYVYNDKTGRKICQRYAKTSAQRYEVFLINTRVGRLRNNTSGRQFMTIRR